jgi:hypothetical protein
MRGFTLLLLIGMGCGHAPDPLIRDPELTPYQERFLGLAREYSLDVDRVLGLEFGDVPVKYAGLCRTSTKTHRRIIISKAYWVNLDDDGKELLMFHELGHCLLDRAHNDEIIGFGTPASIMNTKLFPGRAYSQQRAAYLDELFNPTQE